MSTFWIAVTVLAGTLATLAGLAAFHAHRRPFRGSTSSTADPAEERPVLPPGPSSGLAPAAPDGPPGGLRRSATLGVTAGSALAGLVGGLLLAGPVGMLAAVYCGLAARGLLRRRAARAEALARSRTLDALCTLAADLRAGLPPAADPPVLPDPRIGRLTTAAWRLAERTGAPLADLVERIEGDARAMSRGQAAAAAEASGARATAWLLAALPAGGLVLGAFMGVNPLAVLLHTPVGAACATGAVLLQSAGLAWANRLATSGVTS